MKTMNAAFAQGMLKFVANRIIDSKTLLTKIDSEIGDGDHGIGMELGMKKGMEKIEQLQDCNDASKVFEVFGKAMLMSMGGASGVIFGSMFMAGAKKQGAKEILSTADFTSMMELSLNAIKERGGASVGDKTMVDALEPAVLAMEAYTGDDFCDLLQCAAEAAGIGAEKTKEYIAKFGRAKSLLERAIGHADAGAVSTSLIFAAMAEYVQTAQ